MGSEISLNFPCLQEGLNGSASLILVRKMFGRNELKLAVSEIKGSKMI
jgi:hypothetical protein